MKICQRIIWLTGHPCIGMSRWVQQLQFRDTAPNELAWENGEAESIKWTWGKTSLVQLWETENTKKKPKLGDSYELFSSLLLYQFELNWDEFRQANLAWRETLPKQVLVPGLSTVHPWFVSFCWKKNTLIDELMWRQTSGLHRGPIPEDLSRTSIKKIVVGRCIKLATANIHQLTVINRLPTWET